MKPTRNKPMRPLKGAIGKKRCEVNLEAILEELGDRLFVNRIIGTLLFFREGLKQVEHVPDKKWRFSLWLDLKAKADNRINTLATAHEMPEILRTHAMCCIAAYYRETVHKENNNGSEELPALQS